MHKSPFVVMAMVLAAMCRIPSADAETDPVDPPLAAFRRFLESTPTLKVTCTNHSKNRTDDYTFSSTHIVRLTLKKKGKCISETEAPFDTATVTYSDGGPVTWWFKPEKRIAGSFKGKEMTPLSAFPMWPLTPYGADFYRCFFLSPDMDKSFEALKKNSRLVGEEMLDGLPCWVVEYVETGGTISRIWIDRRDGAMRRCLSETKPGSDPEPQLNDSQGGTYCTDYTGIQTHPDLPDSLFAFKPAPEVRIKTTEESEKEDMEPEAFLLPVGSVAPDFEATGMDGETVRLSDYKGKVVVLNFWYYL